MSNTRIYVRVGNVWREVQSYQLAANAVDRFARLTGCVADPAFVTDDIVQGHAISAEAPGGMSYMIVSDRSPESPFVSGDYR